jgi:Uma2 family endonuclease
MGTLPAAPAKPATLADLEALPESVKGEIIDGVLYTQARPRGLHTNLATTLGGEINGAYQHGRGGPGGWWISVEPGVELSGSPEFSPDLAGWRRERLPAMPADDPIRIVPDWVCEILSPRTRGYDQRVKRPFYARVGVGYLWYIDTEARTLTVSKLAAGGWLEILVAGDRDVIRASPFDAVELALRDWWGDATA